MTDSSSPDFLSALSNNLPAPQTVPTNQEAGLGSAAVTGEAGDEAALV